MTIEERRAAVRDSLERLQVATTVHRTLIALRERYRGRQDFPRIERLVAEAWKVMNLAAIESDIAHFSLEVAVYEDIEEPNEDQLYYLDDCRSRLATITVARRAA